jgi:adenylate cyclase
MGSAERFDYSVLGETVNVAARAEAACKETGCNITLVGELIGKSQTLATLNAGKLELRGKTLRMQAHAIFASEQNETHQELIHGMPTKSALANLPENYRSFFAKRSKRGGDYQ